MSRCRGAPGHGDQQSKQIGICPYNGLRNGVVSSVGWSHVPSHLVMLHLSFGHVSFVTTAPMVASSQVAPGTGPGPDARVR